MRIEMIAAGVYATNCYVITCEDTLETCVIDPGGSVDRIKQYLTKNRLKLNFIILTHGHGDHMMGVPELKAAYKGVKVYAHKNDQYMLEDKNINLSTRIQGPEVEFSADVLLKHGDKLKVGNLELEILHTPGHSKGGISIVVEDCVFVGDTLFAGSIGRTDLDGGNMDKLTNSVRNKLFQLPDDYRVFPGHGGPTTIKREKDTNPFFRR